MVTKKELYAQAKAIKSQNCPSISRYTKRQLNLFIVVKGKKAKPDKNLKLKSPAKAPAKAQKKAPAKAQKKNLNPPVVIKQPKKSNENPFGELKETPSNYFRNYYVQKDLLKVNFVLSKFKALRNNGGIYNALIIRKDVFLKTNKTNWNMKHLPRVLRNSTTKPKTFLTVLKVQEEYNRKVDIILKKLDKAAYVRMDNKDAKKLKQSNDKSAKLIQSRIRGKIARNKINPSKNPFGEFTRKKTMRQAIRGKISDRNAFCRHLRDFPKEAKSYMNTYNGNWAAFKKANGYTSSWTNKDSEKGWFVMHQGQQALGFSGVESCSKKEQDEFKKWRKIINNTNGRSLNKQEKEDAQYRRKGEMTVKEEKEFYDNLKITKKKDTFDYSSLLPDESAKPKKQSKDKPTKAKKKEKPLSYDKWNDVFRGGTGNKKGYDRYLSRF